jgi:probable HAF family extracellular repeat protein
MIMLFAAWSCLVSSSAIAQKKPGVTYKYTLTDLLGLSRNEGYQSQGQLITNRNAAGESLILGISYPGPTYSHPALWNIRADGTFPATSPMDLGVPFWSREVRPTGLNRYGIHVGETSWANTQDADGNWIFPSYVDVPGFPLQELPGVVDRNASASGINDAGTIIGTLAVFTDDPAYPQGIKGEGAVWQVQTDGSIGAPQTLGDFYPDDINHHGVMAGTLDGYPAIGWFEGEFLQLVPMAPNARFFGAGVRALNDYPAGDARLAVVGDSFRNDLGQTNAADSQRGVVWRPFNSSRPTTVLGTLGGNYSSARDVNRAEQIVGDSSEKRGGQFAFVYANGTMTKLNAITAVGERNLQLAFGINDNGDIVGFMQVPRPTSEQHGFLLRPITP